MWGSISPSSTVAGGQCIVRRKLAMIIHSLLVAKLLSTPLPITVDVS